MTIVKLLVDNGAQILKPKGDGMNVLHVAASSNDIHLLDYAIKEISRQAKDDLQSTVNSSNFIDLQNQDVRISPLKLSVIRVGPLPTWPLSWATSTHSTF